ncbi:DUF1287 domain-containing protein [soil metagenome]
MHDPIKLIILFAVSVVTLAGCTGDILVNSKVQTTGSTTEEHPPLANVESEPIRKMLQNATEQTKTTPGYTQEYFVIPYPGGDVPIETGACTDVIIRSMRAAGVDLQKEVREDMRANFAEYPQKWGLRRPDTNIDHRRVPNLQKYFARKGTGLPLNGEDGDFQPGDIVSWDLNGRGMTHIGLVSNVRNRQSGRYMIIHNIGSGVMVEDRLFEWKITGHYRYF